MDAGPGSDSHQRFTSSSGILMLIVIFSCDKVILIAMAQAFSKILGIVMIVILD
jgi:hypothetical protein